MRKPRYGILGGSFDPVHNGHIQLAQYAKDEMKLDKVVFIPAYSSPFKNGTYVSGDDRYAMIKLVTDEWDGFIVNGMELAKESKSYTVDTLKKLSGKYDSELYFICGSDVFMYMDNWRDFRTIAKLTRVITIQRQGFEQAGLLAKAEEMYRRYSLRSSVLSGFNPLEISSTDIREKAAVGEDLSGLVPDRVREYILEKELYRGQ